MIGRVLGIGIIAAAAIMVVVTLVQWEIRQQTDDATVRANFVGIAPQVNGHIVELPVRDNQLEKEGDLFFLIDPRPYKIALERARATFALTRKEVDGLRNSAATAVAGVSKAEAQLNASASVVTSREMDPIVADAEIARLEAQFQHADEHLKRVEPLLPLQFVTQNKWREARTERAWRCSPWWILAPGTSWRTSVRRSYGTFLRARRWICTCSRSRASTSAAASLGWVGRCCRRTAQASMACRKCSARLIGSASPHVSRYASKWIIRMIPFALVLPQ